MWKYTATLISESEYLDDSGDVIENADDTEKNIYCNLLSINQSEFYQAMATGFKPEAKLEIYAAEYSGEKKVRINNRVYDVIRIFSGKNSDVLEITLGSDINGNSSK